MWMRRDLRLYSFLLCVFTFHSFPLDCIAILPSFPACLMPTSLEPSQQHTSRLAHIVVDIWVGWDSLCMSVWRCCVLGPTHRSCEFLLIRLELSAPLSLVPINSLSSHFFPSSLSNLAATFALSHILTPTASYAAH
jgi:hypothetical protein